MNDTLEGRVTETVVVTSHNEFLPRYFGPRKTARSARGTDVIGL